MKVVFCILGLFLFLPPCKGLSVEEKKTIRLASLNWRPYTGEDLKQQGLLSHIIKEAFKKEGYQVDIAFFPWKRAVHYVEVNSEYVGYFPEYYSEEISKKFIFSESLGQSPLGFVEHSSHPIHWVSLDDLIPYRIGVVSGYINTKAFDALVQNKVLKTEEVTNDLLNLLKVSKKKIPLAVIDKNVMKYLVQQQKDIPKIEQTVQFNSRILGNKTLHICFRNNERGKELNDLFSAGLKKLNVEDVKRAYVMLED